MPRTSNKQIDFLLITALAEERDALLRKLPTAQKMRASSADINIYYKAELPVRFPDNTTDVYSTVLMPLLRMGRVKAAAATTNAIQRWKPRYVILLGIAGGLAAAGVKMGDILLADQVADYELQKVTPTGSEVRWEVYRTDPRLLGESQSIPMDKVGDLVQVKRPVMGQPRRHVGSIASGDKVVAVGEVLKQYQKTWPKLIGVEMEAAGVAEAAFDADSPPGFFMIRAASDMADKEKDTPRVEKWRAYACDMAAAYTVALLKSGPVPAQPTGLPAIQKRPEWADIDQYPWQPFLSFRYLEGLDSTRFANLSETSPIRMLSAKSELLETLLFGDGIALSENQIIDSRGAIESLSELIQGASEAGVKIPIRLATRVPNQSVFDLMSQRIGNIDPITIDRRFVISANPALDLDVDRRKRWSEYLALGSRGRDNILKISSASEAEFVNNWFDSLDYVDRVSNLVISARNIPHRFPNELNQILSLTPADLTDMLSQTRDANIPEIMHPKWFLNREEAEAADTIISELRAVIQRIGDMPNARSPIYSQLADLERSKPQVAEGVKEIVDSIYNHTMGLAVDAASISDTTAGDARNIYVRAAHALSQWVRQTEKTSDGSFSYEVPWAWGGASQFTWSGRLVPEQINQIIREVPWLAILEATKEAAWKHSLAVYRAALENLQSIDRISITVGAMGSEWRQRHLDAHKALNEAWQKHIDLSTRMISNQYWRLTADGIQYHLPESGNRPLPVFQNHRTMGTAADYPIEMPLFRSSVIQRTEFEQNIFGAISEIARKRPH